MNLFSKQSKAPVEIILRTIPDNKSFKHLIPKNYRTRVKKNSNNKHFSRTKKYVTLGMVSIIAGIALFIGGGVSSTGSSVANAGILDPLCGYSSRSIDGTIPTVSPQYWPGALGLIVQGTTDVSSSIADAAKLSGNKIGNIYDKWNNVYAGPATAYETFGTAGLNWSNERYQDLGASCLPVVAYTMNSVANIFFNLDQLMASIGLTIYGWAINVDIFSPFFDTIKKLFIGDGTTGNPGLVHLLFLNYLSLIVMLGALLMGWQGLVKKRSSEAVQSAIWMIGSAGLILAFLSHPIGVASTLDKGLNYTTSTLISTLSNVGSAGDGSGSQNMCELSGNLPATDLRGARMGQCSIWKTFLYTPWAAGQFGNLANAKVPNAKKVVINNESTLDGKGQTVSSSSSFSDTTYPLVYLDAHVLNHDQVIQTYPKSQDAIDVANAQKILSPILSDKTINETILVNTLINNYGKKGSISQAGVPSFTGDDWTGRLSIAFLDIVAMLVSMIPILTFTFSMIGLQLILVFLFLVAPFALTLGVNPGFGRKITMTWIEMVAGAALKIVGNAFLLGILMFFIQVIMGMGGAWIIQVLMITMACFGIMVYRKKILSGFKLSLGGSGHRGSAELQQAGSRFFRNAGTVTKDALDFEGGFTKGVASGLVGRNKRTRQFVTAGKDIKKAVDKRRNPLTPIEAKAAVAKKAQQEKMSQDNIMEETNLEDMAFWAKQAKKTNSPVPRPTNPKKAAWLEGASVPMRDRVINSGKLTNRETYDQRLNHLKNRAELINDPEAMNDALYDFYFNDIYKDSSIGGTDRQMLNAFAERNGYILQVEREITKEATTKAETAKAVEKEELIDSVNHMTKEVIALRKELKEITKNEENIAYSELLRQDTFNRIDILEENILDGKSRLKSWNPKVNLVIHNSEDNETNEISFDSASQSNPIRIEISEFSSSPSSLRNRTDSEESFNILTSTIDIDTSEVLSLSSEEITLTRQENDLRDREKFYKRNISTADYDLDNLARKLLEIHPDQLKRAIQDYNDTSEARHNYEQNLEKIKERLAKIETTSDTVSIDIPEVSNLSETALEAEQHYLRGRENDLDKRIRNLDETLNSLYKVRTEVDGYRELIENQDLNRKDIEKVQERLIEIRKDLVKKKGPQNPLNKSE